MNFNINLPNSTNVTKRVEMKPWQKILFGLIFVIVGILLTGLGIYQIIKFNGALDTYETTIGKVVEIIVNDDGLYGSIIEYEVNGEGFEIQPTTFSSVKDSLDKEYHILYNKDDPNDYQIKEDKTRFVLLGIGVLFSVCGLIVVISVFKEKKKLKNIQQNNGQMLNNQNQGIIQNDVLSNQQPMMGQQVINNQMMSQPNMQPVNNQTINQQSMQYPEQNQMMQQPVNNQQMSNQQSMYQQPMMDQQMINNQVMSQPNMQPMNNQMMNQRSMQYPEQSQMMQQPVNNQQQFNQNFNNGYYDSNNQNNTNNMN